MLMQNSPLAMVEWDAERTVTGWNAAAAALFNFFEDEAIGANLDYLLTQRQIADLELDTSNSEKAGVLREHVSVEGRKLCRWYMTPFVVKGECVETLATIVDVTHQTALSNEELRSQLQLRTQVLRHTTDRLQKAMSARDRTIAELQSAHVFLDHLINAISDPIFVEDEHHTGVMANDAFCQFVGRSRQDLIGQHTRDIFPETTSAATLQQDSHTLYSGHPYTVQDYVQDARGRTRFVATTKTRFQDLEEQPYLLCVTRDLTEQIVAQTSLKENEKRLKKLAANVPGMIYQFRLGADLKPSFPFVSHSSQMLFGLSHKAIQADANTIINLIHPDDVDSFNRVLTHSAQTLCEWQWQGRFLTSDGRTVWIQGISRPERMADNSIVWDGLLMDISHTKQAEADLLRSEVELRAQADQLRTTLHQLKRTQTKLIQSEKMSSLGQLVAGIAHEINNPVNFIHGNLAHVQSYVQDMMQIVRCYQAHYPAPIPIVQELSEELDIDYIVQDLPKLIGSVKSGTERIRQIVLSLRSFSRLDESALKLADIHEGLESTLMIVGSRLEATERRCAIEIVKAYENIPLVECYASQLNQVFLNILTNAIDAIDLASEADKAYQIVLQTFQTADTLVVRISNNGLPISPADKKRLFDPFFTTKPVGKGTGMGLAISYQTMVDLHKGTLEYSQSEDGKTTFTLEIPTRSSERTAVAALNVCS